MSLASCSGLETRIGPQEMRETVRQNILAGGFSEYDKQRYEITPNMSERQIERAINRAIEDYEGLKGVPFDYLGQ